MPTRPARGADAPSARAIATGVRARIAPPPQERFNYTALRRSGASAERASAEAERGGEGGGDATRRGGGAWGVCFGTFGTRAYFARMLPRAGIWGGA